VRKKLGLKLLSEKTDGQLLPLRFDDRVASGLD
jgi:hypothetical protein